MLQLKIADSKDEFEQIHQLNYKTFVEEIPQHASNDSSVLVDKFHIQNQYVVAKEGQNIVGMLSFCSERPFSVESKVPNIQQHLPPFEHAVELRLLSIQSEKRGRRILERMLAFLVKKLAIQSVDLVLISATTRQLPLYSKIGFIAFGPLVGTEKALYQPMYLTRNTVNPTLLSRWLQR